MLLWVCWSCAAAAALWLYCREAYSYFSRRGVSTLTPVPVLGNMGGTLLRINHMSEQIQKTYSRFSGERFVGSYEFFKPLVVIRDIELLKKITIKDFDHFLDHRTVISETIDPLFGRNLISLKGQEWKDMRSTLSPAFTSSKIRLMVPFMVEIGDQMTRSLRKKIQESGADYVEIDVKDLTTRYANDVIASCAFGLKVDSQADKDNQFYANGKEATNFSFKQMLIFMMFMSFPKLMKVMRFTLFSKQIQSFFKTLVTETMRERESKHIIRPDMIHLLMEAKKGQLTHDKKTIHDTDAGFATVEESAVGKKDINIVWSENDLVAQAVLFFIAGFDTVSSAMTFVVHELSINPDVQEKLYQEIQDNDAMNAGKFDYNSVQSLTYLDMVVSEVLRLWPPAIATDRLCTKDYNLGKPNDKTTKDFIIRTGEVLQIPVWGFHRDPEFFPNPDRFDPERFSEENKQNIKPFTYMPFGLGPRNCIGSRFALCEVKVMVYQLMQSMQLSPGEKTKLPATLSTETFNLCIKGGHWVRLRPRN